MNDLVTDLQRTVQHAAERLLAIPESHTHFTTLDGQWSAKQVLGHLIDSAANNHSRFVQAQFTEDLRFAGYDQEQWVRAQHYDQADWPALVQLWKLYNLHLAHVIAHIPESTLKQRRSYHTLDHIAWQTVRAGEPTTLEYLIQDYLGHLKAHLEQIFAAAKR